MLKRLIRRTLRRLGYEILKVPVQRPAPAVAEPHAVAPVWPLPRAGEALSDDDLRRELAKFPHWHYAYEFEGGVSLSTSHINPGLDTDDPIRPLQRFRHFMPYLGSLQGKRVLDIACNSGWWSIQCALLGADVVGFDARPELIAQANLLKRITGVTAEFKVLDFADMTPEALGGQFDVVLNFGFLYHAPQPLEVLERTKAMTRRHILLDTAVYPSEELAIFVQWEEPFDIRTAVRPGMVAHPTKRAIDLMLAHMGVKAMEIPVRTNDMPRDYLANKRASWLISV